MMIKMVLAFHRKHPRAGSQIFDQRKIALSLVRYGFVVPAYFLFPGKERKIYICTAVCGNSHFEQKRFIRFVFKFDKDITSNGRMFYFCKFQCGRLWHDFYFLEAGFHGFNANQFSRYDVGRYRSPCMVPILVGLVLVVPGLQRDR